MTENSEKPSTVLIDPLLLSNFVHQIINPLNGVVGTLDNVIDGTITDAGRRSQRLEAVRGQLKHSIEMIRNLAFLSQLATDDGAASLAKTVTDVCIPKLIIEAAQFFQEAGHTRGRRIVLTDRDTQYYVKGHADLLRQVFMNLFDNGVKYGNANSEVRVTPRPQKGTGHLFVEVESRGATFDNDEREKIFEMGYRGQAARDATSSGSGLGLFICRRILTLAHRASIEAERSSSGIALFRIRFGSFTIGGPYADTKDK